MKHFLKVFIPILLIVALLAAACWFLLVERKDLTASVFRYWGDYFRDAGRHNRSVFFYRTAWKLQPHETKFPLRLANSYVALGNYTKAEYTLVSAIMQIPDSPELYVALSRVYVAQDKLLDAESMLSRITNDAVREQLDAMRPAAPEIMPESGYYSDYIDVTISGGSGTIYAVRNLDFPSSESDLYTEPFRLEGGETRVVAIAVAPNGLVSAASYAGYTVGNVVEEVTIQDKALDSLVRTALEKLPADPLMSDELWAIEELSLPETVTSLEDLPLFKGLRSLSLHHATGLDLTVLAQLPTLQSLDLSGCTLSSGAMETIVALPELLRLDLESCAIVDINALVGLQKLEYLDLSNNTVSDLTALSALSSLKELYLTNNPVGSISNLNNCAALEVLHADSCQLTKLNGLIDHRMLRELCVSDNRISDITLLGTCPALETIDISNNQVTDISVLAELKSLSVVQASNNRIASIPVFDKTTPLWRFDVSYNQIPDLEGLVGNETVNFINADYNEVTSIGNLESCLLLVQVDIWDNPVGKDDVKKLQDIGIVVNYNPEYEPPEPKTDED